MADSWAGGQAMPAQVSQAPRCLQPLLFSTRGSPEGEVTPVQWTGGEMLPSPLLLKGKRREQELP